MPNRSVFFVSDGTGITAETFGNSILAQFPAVPRHVRRPFIETPDKAREVLAATQADAIMIGRAAITVDYDPGKVVDVRQHDGSVMRLRKLNDDYDPTNRLAAQNFLQRHAAKGEVVTGHEPQPDLGATGIQSDRVKD